MTQHCKVLIAGSGPAGLTAAIYASRAELAPIVIEGEPSSTSDQPGGQLMLTTEIENFPGFPSGTTGPELMASMRAQAERFGARTSTAKVQRVDLASSPFKVWVQDPETPEPTYSCDALIVATGARSLLLGLPGENELIGHGVSTCATCDGFFFKNQQIAVVGGGDSAIEEALFLTRFADKVTLIHRRDKLRASRIMQERAFSNKKIEIRWNSVVTRLHGDGRLDGVEIRDTLTDESSDLSVTGLFFAIGHQPATEIFAGQLDIDELGYIVTGSGSRTSVDGVFACGDVQDHVYRQAITAAGSGCVAAIDAEHWLANLGS